MMSCHLPLPSRRSTLGLAVLAASCLIAVPASAQLVVYGMDFKRTDGFNDRPLTGGYFVAPVAGGTGSFVFTQQGTSGTSIVPAQDSAKFFRLVTEDRQIKWVAQAQVGSATTTPTPTPDDGTDGGDDDDDGETPTTPVEVATGTFLSYGESNLNHTFRTPLLSFETRIAKSLEGRTVSASSESLNGSTRFIGFVSRGDWKLNFDERQTNHVNRQDMDLATATEYLVDVLEGPDGGGGTVDRRLFILTSSPLPTATRNLPYLIDLQSSGGVAPRSWAVATGSSLPTGLTLTAGGRLSGTPTAVAANYTFTLVLSDAASTPTVSRSYTLQILEQLTITSASPLAAGQVGSAYGPLQLTAAGGTGALTWTLNSGSPPLPDGLILSAGGILTGTPTTGGDYTFTIRATDSGSGSNQQSTTKNFEINISP